MNEYLVELEKQEKNHLLEEEKVWEILLDMCLGIKHVHDSGYIHLDIKPSNFFVTSDFRIKLGDFGIAIHVDDVTKLRDDDVEGDSIYMAPELL